MNPTIYEHPPMMKLTLMKRFFDTVDGDWHSPLIEQIAAPWVSGSADVRMLRASANFVCVFRTPAGRFFLRFNHDSERSADFIAGELEAVCHVSAGGVRAARPVPSQGGRLVESVETSLGIFHAVVFEAVPGTHWEFDELDLPRFERWGQVVGKVHRAGRGLKLAGRPDWTDWITRTRAFIPVNESLARRELDAVETGLRGMGVNGDNYGFIHFDLELDNLCWENEQAGVIDFDDCGTHWYAADIAFALRDLFDNHCSQIIYKDERLLAFLRGYRTQHSLDESDLIALPLFLRMSNLVNFGRISRAMAEGPLDGEAPWLTGLRGHLEGMLDGFRRDFAEYPIHTILKHSSIPQPADWS